MSGEFPLLQIPSQRIGLHVPLNQEQLTEKEEFYENFLNYREIVEIDFKSYSIKKERFREYAVPF